MSLFARLKPPTRAKLSRACGVRKCGALLESVEPRLLFTTFIVTTASDAPGHTGVSLRDAITSANVNSDADTIHFNIGAGQQVITLQNSALPTITQPLTIDAQSPIDTPAGQIVEVNGNLLTFGANGFTISASNSGIQGLRITNFRTLGDGTGGNGIVITGSTNGVASCMIGIGADSAAHGNLGKGILISGGSDNFVINTTIANNGDDGIAVTNANGVGENFVNNTIYSNNGLGIDVGADGIAPNNTSDDTGANLGQNYPVLSTAVISTSNGTTSATIAGTVSSTPNTLVYLNFYAGTVAAREGRVALTQRDGSGPIQTTVTTNGTGTAAFSGLIFTPLVGSLSSTTATFITATATTTGAPPVAVPPRLSTSEFSAPIGAVSIAGAQNLPRVQNVFVKGTAWADAFLTYVQNVGAGSRRYGYAIPTSNGTLNLQARALPWTNINQISIQFTEQLRAAAPTAADLTSIRNSLIITGAVSIKSNYDIASFTYDSDTFTGTWTLTAPITAANKVRLNLDADGTGIIDADNGNHLDGEWAGGNTPTGTTTSTFPSGNSVAGGDFLYEINVVPGDVNQSVTPINGQSVNSTDLIATRNRQFTSTVDTSIGTVQVPILYSIFHDVNASNAINSTDLIAVRNRQFISVLPDDVPPAPLTAGDTKVLSASRFRKSLLA